MHEHRLAVRYVGPTQGGRVFHQQLLGHETVSSNYSKFLAGCQCRRRRPAGPGTWFTRLLR
jgi:hypothetical protein